MCICPIFMEYSNWHTCKHADLNETLHHISNNRVSAPRTIAQDILVSPPLRPVNPSVIMCASRLRIFHHARAGFFTTSPNYSVLCCNAIFSFRYKLPITKLSPDMMPWM